MTTPIQSPNESVGYALAAFMRIEWLMLLVWAMTLVYMFVRDHAEAENARTDRIRNEQRHQEVMESLRGVPKGVVQQVRVEQRAGRFEELVDDIAKRRAEEK